MKSFAKKTIARMLLVAAVIAIVSSALFGCGKSEDAYYTKSENAVAAIEDAIFVLKRCADERITPEECVEELEAIERAYEKYRDGDSILDLALISLSVTGSEISVGALKSESMAIKAAEEAIAKLEDKLKN